MEALALIIIFIAVLFVVFVNHHNSERIDTNKYKGIYSNENYYDEWQ